MKDLRKADRWCADGRWGVETPRARRWVRYEFSGVLDYVLVVWSNLDRVLPVWQAHEAVARLRRGCLALIPACGHLPQVEHPRRFAAELGELLAGQDS